MFRRLRNRFLALNMTLTSLILVAAFAVVYVTSVVSSHAQNQRDLEALGSLSILTLASDEGSALSLQGQGETIAETTVHDEEVLTAVGAGSISTFTVMVDKSGDILSVDSFLELPQEVYEQATAQAWENPEGTVLKLLGRQWLYSVTSAGSYAVISDGNTVTATTSENSNIRFLDITKSQVASRNLLLILIIVGLAALAAVLAVSLLFANRSIMPIAQAWEQQRRFIADASHELKTPLAIITTNSDALLANQEQTIASQREWLDYLRIGTDRMNDLIDELLVFARIEDTGNLLPTEPVDLSAAVQRVLQSLNAGIRARRLQVTVDIESDLIRVLEPGLVDKVLFALIENAVKYTDEGGWIEVVIRSSESAVVLTVKNSGPGIAPNDLPHIFERFYRADRARFGDDNSFGLGLSIAKEAVRRLGGEINAQSSPGEFTQFSVKF
jgi:signal transduction histidine kinase